MIEVPWLGDDLGRMWASLFDICDRMPAGWTIIGGQMVALFGFEAGQRPSRFSEDLDLVVDARARPLALPRMMETLADLGFTHDGISPEGVAHRFSHGVVVIDILASDHVGVRADLTTVAGARTIEAPGGSYALATTTLVEVSYGGRSGSVPRPSLAGALVCKAEAVFADTGPDGVDRHLSDLAFLASLVPDVRGMADLLGHRRREKLARVQQLADPSAEAWIVLGAERDDGFAAWQLLTRPD